VRLPARLAVAAVVVASLGRGGATAGEYRALDERDPAYPLDKIARNLPARGRFTCPEVPLLAYRGQVIRYHKPVRIYPELRPRLVMLEEVAREAAIAVYGRPPIRLRHAGTFNCRRIAAYPGLLSEHGLANAIDVAGFDFAPAPAARGRRRSSATAAAVVAAPPGLEGAFQVRLGAHWQATAGVAAVHARFLDTLARRLVARPEIFRVLLGPAFPGHKGHFHFDMAPYRLEAIWQNPLE
jgi:hypothetical protein